MKTQNETKLPDGYVRMMPGGPSLTPSQVSHYIKLLEHSQAKGILDAQGKGWLIELKQGVFTAPEYK